MSVFLFAVPIVADLESRCVKVVVNDAVNVVVMMAVDRDQWGLNVDFDIFFLIGCLSRISKSYRCPTGTLSAKMLARTEQALRVGTEGLAPLRSDQ